MLTYDWLKNNVIYVTMQKNSTDEYRNYTIGPKNKDDYGTYKFNANKVGYFNTKLACVLFLISKSSIYRESIEDNRRIERFISFQPEKLTGSPNIYDKPLSLKKFRTFLSLKINNEWITTNKAVAVFIWIATSFFHLNSICSDIFRIYKDSYITKKDFFLTQGVNDIYRDELLLYILLSFPEYMNNDYLSTSTIEELYNNLITDYEDIYNQNIGPKLHKKYKKYKTNFQLNIAGKIKLDTDINSYDEQHFKNIDISNFSNFEEKDYIDYYSLIFDIFFLESSNELCTKYRNNKKIYSLLYTDPTEIDNMKKCTNVTEYTKYSDLIEEHETSQKTFYCINKELKTKIDNILFDYKTKLDRNNLEFDLSKFNIKNAFK